MKFSKLLEQFEGGSAVEADSEDRDMFLRYKLLKKRLKAAADRQAELLAKREAKPQSEAESSQTNKATLPLTEEEKEFIQMLQADVDRINTHFMEREEEAVIKLQALIDRRESLEGHQHEIPASPSSSESMRAAFIDFHGEMVLLLHWSLVNYAGIVKILKKHDKLLGGHAQKIYLRNVLQQPFTSTENISKLVREAEAQVQSLGIKHESKYATADEENIIRQEKREAKLLKRTRAALGMLSELQDGAHTPSTLLPSKLV